MKRIFSKSTLREFWAKYPDSENSLKEWYANAKEENWQTPNDIKKTYSTASILKENRVVFNIKGNSYRLVVKFNYKFQWAFIRFIGTHTEYDKIDSNTI